MVCKLRVPRILREPPVLDPTARFGPLARRTAMLINPFSPKDPPANFERGTLQKLYRAGFTSPYRDAPPPRRDLLARQSFLTTTSVIATRGCHNRCGFCYLATDGLRMPYQMLDPKQVVDQVRADD